MNIYMTASDIQHGKVRRIVNWKSIFPSINNWKGLGSDLVSVIPVRCLSATLMLILFERLKKYCSKLEFPVVIQVSSFILLYYFLLELRWWIGLNINFEVWYMYFFLGYSVIWNLHQAFLFVHLKQNLWYAFKCMSSAEHSSIQEKATAL